MEENMADDAHAPSAALMQLYRAWADGGAGLILTGNVMIDRRAMTGPGGVVLEDPSQLQAFRNWARIGRAKGAQFWLQLNHPGRQMMKNLGQETWAPSAVPLDLGKHSKMFATPKAMTEQDIHEVIARFVNAARLGEQAGFSGVQIHAAHGYLFNQFLSPLVNQRTDRWGGSLENRMRLLLETVREIRATTSAQFLIAVKLNSADFQRGGFDADDSLTVARALEKEGIDLLEISGGTYESTAMVTGMPQRESTRAREAYFLEFAERFSQELSVPVMLTGGFRTRQGMKDALDSGAVDIVGLARPITYEPDLPRRLLDGTAEKSLVTPKTLGHKNIDDLLNSAWHQQQIARMGRGRAVRPRRSPAIALAIALLTTSRDLLVPWLAPS
jgi:2,4-dienoyl-CoA reductase-like NADH-dependent reductase (Old Yellow Enzyme family)